MQEGRNYRAKVFQGKYLLAVTEMLSNLKNADCSRAKVKEQAETKSSISNGCSQTAVSVSSAARSGHL